MIQFIGLLFFFALSAMRRMGSRRATWVPVTANPPPSGGGILSVLSEVNSGRPGPEQG